MAKTKEKETQDAGLDEGASATSGTARGAVVAFQDASTQLTPAQMLELDAGAGFEDVTPADLTLPQIKLLQSGSPEVKRSMSSYVDGAQEGMWLDVVSHRMFREVIFVPCKFMTKYLEWDSGQLGKLIHDHGLDRTLYDKYSTAKTFGAVETPEGHSIVPTATWYGIVIGGIEVVDRAEREFEGRIKGVISMASTATKVSRRWVSEAESIRYKRADGSSYTPALYAMSYRLGSAATQNDQGSWFLPTVDRAGFITDRADGAQLLEDAREFYAFVGRNKPQTVVSSDESSATSDDTRDYRRAAARSDHRPERRDDGIPF